MNAALQILAGWALADLLSGLAHLILDRATFLRSWPVLGPIHRDVVAHHDLPGDMLRRSFLAVTGQSLLVAAPFLVFVWWPWFGVPLAFGLAFSTRTHVWSHRRVNPLPVRLLQRLRLVLPPAWHDRHHRNPDRAYAVVCGWTNPLIDGALDLIEGRR